MTINNNNKRTIAFLFYIFLLPSSFHLCQYNMWEEWRGYFSMLHFSLWLLQSGRIDTRIFLQI